MNNNNLYLEEDDDGIIIKKKGIIMKRIDKNMYKLTYNIKNKSVYLPKLLDFNIIKLVYNVNPEIFQEVNLEIIDDTHAKIFVLMKPLFSDFGMPQRYAYLNVEKHVVDKFVCFTCFPVLEINKSEIYSKHNLPQLCENLPVEEFKMICKIVDNHHLEIEQTVCYNQEFEIPKFMEKFAGTIFTKLYLRTKEFIENLVL